VSTALDVHEDGVVLAHAGNLTRLQRLLTDRVGFVRLQMKPSPLELSSRLERF
jgi:hypothetical protein